MINAGLALDLHLEVKAGIARQLREAADALHDMAEVLDPTGPAEMSQYAKAAYDEATDLAYRNGYKDGQREAEAALILPLEALAAEFKRGWAD